MTPTSEPRPAFGDRSLAKAPNTGRHPLDPQPPDTNRSDDNPKEAATGPLGTTRDARRPRRKAAPVTTRSAASEDLVLVLVSHRVPASLDKAFKIACIERGLKQQEGLRAALELWLEEN